MENNIKNKSKDIAIKKVLSILYEKINENNIYECNK